MEDEHFFELEKGLKYIEDLSMIKSAYKTAKNAHKGQYRLSGEKFIYHPIEVAKIAAIMHADEETIAAALLHDTIEDTYLEKKNIEYEFGSIVANLVDGVTKEKKELFKNEIERKIFNNNKLVLSSNNDIRVMIIKLADRLHNMITIGYQSSESIIDTAIETKDFYVEVADLLGIEIIKSPLEDISFKCLNSELYDLTELDSEYILYISKLDNLKAKIELILKNNNINGKIKIVIDNISQTYKKIQNENYYLFTFYIIVDEKDKEKIKNLDCNYIKVLTKEEYIKIKYGIAANYFNNTQIQNDFKNKGLDAKLLEINANYIKTLSRN